MFHAKVKGRVFQILGIDYITSGSVGLQIDFEFDDEWTGLERYATFEAGSVSISVELENDTCVIPWEVLEDPNVNLRIGIRGSNGNDVVIPTIWKEYEIHEGAKFSEDSGSPASLNVIEQLSARMDALEENGGVDIFWATYDLSSYDEIYEQFNTHNRLVSCVYSNHIYFMQKEINNSTAYKFFAPDFTSTQSRIYWLIVDNNDQWTNGYEEITSGGGDTPEIAWVTYGVTTYSEVKAAYDAGKLVLCEYDSIYQLTYWMGLNGPFFTFTAPVYDSRVTTQSIHWLEVNSSGWSNGSIDIPAAGTATPLMDGTAAVGSSNKFAKEDHRHPSDTSKAAKDIYLTATLSGNSVSVASIAPFTSSEALADYIDGIVWLKCLDTAAEAWIIPLINAYKIEWEEEEIEEVTCYFTFSGVVYDGSAPAVYSVVFEDVATDATSMSGTLHEMSGGGGTSDYDNLTDKPQINGVTLSGNKSASDLSLGTYSKPSGGIPASDMASAVQTSLGKADSAYQKPSGGIPASDLASGVIPTVPSAATAAPADLGTAAVGSSSKYAKEDHVHKLPTLSELGAEPAWSAEANIQDGAVTKSLSERVFCIFTGDLTSLTITLGGDANGHYHFDFSTGSTAPTLTLPSSVLTPDGFQVEANKAYEVDILNKHAAIQSWSLS